jgi:peptidoglycan/LPS O-acetylase OafA/YrhL
MSDFAIMGARAQPPQVVAPGIERRIGALDGLRGLMTIVVLASHYFAEIHGGSLAFAFGWVAVDVFFVLSGFLVGRLILDKGETEGFLRVFFIRRVCRTFPIYFTCVIGAYLLLARQPVSWSDMDRALPFWSYLAFTQNMLFASATSIGVHWLSPTWTMAVEEQFYLLAPALILLTPRRNLPWLLLAIMLAAAGFRLGAHLAGWPPFYALCTLPARADALAAGMLAAFAFASGWGEGGRGTVLVRWAAPALLMLVVLLRLVEGPGGAAFGSVGFLAMASAAALFILSLAREAPEAKRFETPLLAFFGHNSFAIYLTHMPLLWLAHGIALDTKPTLSTTEGLLVTLAAIPLCLFVSRFLTWLIEEPATRFGRSFAWGARS